MSHSEIQLLRQKRFLPFFLTQFLGAFNDNVYRNALAMLVTFKMASADSSIPPEQLVSLAAALFVLPFFLFSAFAGQIADKFEKSMMIRNIKWAEVVIMVFGSVGFWLESVPMMMSMLFLLGTQAAFFGPLKYSILPQHLHKDELIGGNGMIEASTFVAILLGTVVGGLSVGMNHGVIVIIALVIGLALLGVLTSYFIPKAAPAAPKLKIRYIGETWRTVHYTMQHSQVFLSILGISWFWLVGMVYLSQFPTYTKTLLHGSEAVVTLLLTIFSVGVAIGSLACNKLLKGQVHAKFVPWAILGMSLFIIELFFASIAWNGTEEIGVREMLTNFQGIRVLVDMLMISMLGGLYIVPLYAIMQSKAEPSHVSRVVASNNIINSLFMVIGSLATMGLLAAKMTIPQIFLLVGIANVGMFFVSKRLVKRERKKAGL